jgi:hypothetical protein
VWLTARQSRAKPALAIKRTARLLEQTTSSRPRADPSFPIAQEYSTSDAHLLLTRAHFSKIDEEESDPKKEEDGWEIIVFFLDDPPSILG